MVSRFVSKQGAFDQSCVIVHIYTRNTPVKYHVRSCAFKGGLGLCLSTSVLLWVSVSFLEDSV